MASTSRSFGEDHFGRGSISCAQGSLKITRCGNLLLSPSSVNENNVLMWIRHRDIFVECWVAWSIFSHPYYFIFVEVMTRFYVDSRGSSHVLRTRVLPFDFFVFSIPMSGSVWSNMG